MSAPIDRRTFTQALLLGLGAASVPALPVWAEQRKRTVKIGHSGITWPGGQGRGGGGAPAPPGPRPVSAEAIETIFKDLSSQGFYGLELFSWQIEGMEGNGGLAAFIEKDKPPVISRLTGAKIT